MKRILIAIVCFSALTSVNAYSQEQKDFTSDDKYKYDGQGYPNIKIDFNKAKVFVLNGKVVAKSSLDAIKKEEIESMVLYSGQEAIDKYGKKAEEGVLEVVTARK